MLSCAITGPDLAYSQSREYCPAEICGGDFPSSGLRDVFTLGNELWKRQNCSVNYQWMMSIVSFFSLHSTTAFSMYFEILLQIDYFTQKAGFYFRQWPRVMPKQEKTREAMRRNNWDDFSSLTFILTLFRDVFRTHSNICDSAFRENSLKLITIFAVKLSHRCSTGFLIHLCFYFKK